MENIIYYFMSDGVYLFRFHGEQHIIITINEVYLG